MPASRTSSIPPRSQPFPAPSPHNKRHNAVARNLDTISLTSSDAENTDPSTKQAFQDKLPPRPRPKKSTFVPRPEDIIEISSDEDDSPSYAPVQPSVIAEHRRQIAKLREESVKQKRDLERVSKELEGLREENQILKALHKPDNNNVVLEMSQLSDHLDCEICTCRMWTPYILPDCGHSFCQTCLQDWFSTTHAQFMAAHPQHPNVNHTFIEILRQIGQNPHIVALPYVQTLIASQMPQRPDYTCPTCRAPVSSRPTEAFAQKALVRTIAAASGEAIPKVARGVTKNGKGTGNGSNPWDGFFPPKTT